MGKEPIRRRRIAKESMERARLGDGLREVRVALVPNLVGGEPPRNRLAHAIRRLARRRGESDLDRCDAQPS